ncbi:hypothetical protein PHET_11517 [Paragonimus heterotremus]|uniref:DNA repair protein SWI5 homolog n=1 Tax=Paragonimus heterotremus TaxID=100268 RepID=A0A8J4SEW1_9TREM|nr:hypothetical protein PHET_11517 [Paragonimus heterotremus]
MSTPSRSARPGSGIHAPFKSPLRTTGNNAQLREGLFDVARPPNTPNSSKWASRRDTLTHSEDCSEPYAEAAVDEEIARLTARYMHNRTEPLDIEKELAVWRNRMHVYNEVKDACLEIFGRLAHAKGCLIRDLYEQFHLEPDD